jgi:hypothetical protein
MHQITRFVALLAVGTTWLAPDAAAFCGFYAARAGADLFNESSKVVVVRDGDRTVVTMASDFRGEATDFALVVPVPTFLEEGQIHVASPALVDHLDAYTAPRLVEYFDPDPCAMRPRLEAMGRSVQELDAALPSSAARKNAFGVTVEAEYTVGEYDIVILSAEESRGLVKWLRANDYALPKGAAPVLGEYLKQGMRFFVARVNLEEQAKLGFRTLRPIQVAYDSRKFMLPIRLGMVNADGPQDMVVWFLTRKGRVETANYRTVRLPTGDEVPGFVKGEFGRFYQAVFGTQVAREEGRAVFLEYAWDMGWCDPCAADPLSPEALRELGVFWQASDGEPRPVPLPQRRILPKPMARDVFVTRLHVRYDDEHFPDDLHFVETADRSNFQGRYVVRHPWNGGATCPAAEPYRRELARRQEHEAQTLASLTGWGIDWIRDRMELAAVAPASTSGDDPWWQRIWTR